MSGESHHTREQVDKAFAYAPVILRKLRDAGVSFPSFELYADASGKLRLGTTDNHVTDEHYKLAQELVFSNRPYITFCERCFAGEDPDEHPHEVGVTFCCGLVTASEGAS